LETLSFKRFLHEKNMDLLFGYFGLPGGYELLIVGVILLLLFGNRVPSVMRSLGRGVTEFKKGVQGIEDEIDEAVNKPAVTSEKDKTAAKDQDQQ
jgi:sec-independent protein translocase protein TatA